MHSWSWTGLAIRKQWHQVRRSHKKVLSVIKFQTKFNFQSDTIEDYYFEHYGHLPYELRC